MIRHNIHRSVKSQQHDRKVGDDPALGRVARMSGAGIKKKLGTRRKRSSRSTTHGNDGEKHRWRKRLILIWSGILAIFALGVIGGALGLWMNRGQLKASASSATPEYKARITSLFPSPSEDEALELVKQAMQAKTPDEVQHYFGLNGERPETILSFLKTMAKEDGPIRGYHWLSSIDSSDLLIDGVRVLLGDKIPQKDRIAMLTPNDEGIWKVDFHSFARTCSLPLGEVIRPDSKGGKVRVIIFPDTYYNAAFADETQWSCFQLLSPDEDTTLLGYCRVNSPQHKALVEVVARATHRSRIDQRPPRGFLEIERVEGGEPRQFEITRVLAEDWLESPTPFDEKFR
jgi:hypothetical protein